MDRLLEHPELFIIIAGVLSYLIKRRKTAADAASRKARSEPTGRPAMERENRRAEEVERARRIREEMLRRRTQRTATDVAGESTPSPQVSAPQVVQPPALAVPRRSLETPPTVYRPSADPLSDVMKEIARRFQPDQEPESDPKAAEAAEAQQRIKLLEARIAVLEREKTAARAKTASAGTTAPDALADQSLGWGVKDLTQPAALRRAILMNEILGRPVGLR